MEVFLKLLTVLACLSQCLATVVEVGAKLGAGSSWKSPGGTFAIGLRPTQPGDSSDFDLSIWYECEAVDLHLKTVVWTAKTINAKALRVSKNSQLQLTSDGGLTVIDGHIVWQSSPSQCCVQSAYMSESGNFIINFTSKSAWESFNLPTDSLLPNQQLVNSPTGVNPTVLSSSSGVYTLNMNIAQALLRSVYMTFKYWSLSNPLLNFTRTCLSDDTGEVSNLDRTCSADPTLSFPPTLNLSTDGVLRFYDGSGESWYKSQTENHQRYAIDYGKNVLRRVTLGDDGNLKMFSLAETNKSWSVVWQAVLKECDVFGTCGPFAYCMYRPEKTCTCPPGFHKVDPADDSKGCDYDSRITCDVGSDVKLVQVNRADYYYNDYNFDGKVKTLEECKSTCLNDCQCRAVAYKYNGFAMCFHKGKSDKLYNGAQSFDLNNIMFMKVRKELPLKDDANDLFVADSNATLTPQVLYTHSQNTAQRVILSIALAQAVIIVCAAAVSWICWYQNVQRIRKEMAEEIHGAPTRFSYKEIQEVTNNFEEKLGSGGFGTVYKGELPSEGSTVAVKVIEAATQTENQFKAEVNTIGRVHHVNLVRLLGYCAEGKHRMLVYEYMPNGSLDMVLFDENLASSAHYDWNTRYSIALGVAKGISYLHEECQECIIHCDIKPQNVLLDEYFHPKISDFGLAKLVTKEHAFSVTTVRGTRGYVAPEWLHNKPITAKVDVYSFGMLLFDILSGRTKLKITPSALERDEWYFPLWAFHKFMSNDLKSVADPKLQNEVQWEEFERLLKIAIWCSQPDADTRPLMSRVVQMLEGNVQVPTPVFPELEGDLLYMFSDMEASRTEVSRG